MKAEFEWIKRTSAAPTTGQMVLGAFIKKYINALPDYDVRVFKYRPHDPPEPDYWIDMASIAETIPRSLTKEEEKALLIKIEREAEKKKQMASLEAERKSLWEGVKADTGAIPTFKY